MKQVLTVFAFLVLLTGCDAVGGEKDPSIASYEVTADATVVDVDNPDGQFTLQLATADTLLTWELRESVGEYTFEFVPSGGTLSIRSWGGDVVDEVAID